MGLSQLARRSANRVIDQATGAGTPVGGETYSQEGVIGLDFGSSGVLWAVYDCCSWLPWGGVVTLEQIDPATGEMTQVVDVDVVLLENGYRSGFVTWYAPILFSDFEDGDTSEWSLVVEE